jgi:4-hydroxybenzoate polyprenyltransferase
MKTTTNKHHWTYQSRPLRQAYEFVAKYLRVYKSLSVLFIPILAFTLSGNTDILNLIVVSCVTFLGIAGTYAYNCLKDAREDRENPLHPNPLGTSTTKKSEKMIPYYLFASAVLVALLFLNPQSSLLFLALASFSVVYSKFKIKRIFLMKTFSVSFCYMLLFFACFLALSNTVSPAAFFSGTFIFILLFSYSVISDIRDLEVDKKHEFITIPVKYGYARAMRFISALWIILNLALIAAYSYNIIPANAANTFLMFLPVEVCLVYYLHTKDLSKVDALRERYFIFISLILLI